MWSFHVITTVTQGAILLPQFKAVMLASLRPVVMFAAFDMRVMGSPKRAKLCACRLV